MEKMLYVLFYTMCRFKRFHSFLVGLCGTGNNMGQIAYDATFDYTMRKEA